MDTVAVSIAANRTYTLNTASRPALTGISGNLAFANNGDWQVLKGKAVAVEPSTGFTFDTLMEYKAR